MLSPKIIIVNTYVGYSLDFVKCSILEIYLSTFVLVCVNYFKQNGCLLYIS